MSPVYGSDVTPIHFQMEGRLKMESSTTIRMGLKVFTVAALVVVYGACASGGGGGSGGGNEPITVHVDNMTNIVVNVERIVATGGPNPVTVRVGQVRGGTQQTLTIPWNAARLAHQLLWLEGLDESTYRVEECRGEDTDTCAATTALHLPRGAEVQLVIDARLQATMYYQVPPGGY